MSQTSYTTDLTAAISGMLADNGPKEIDAKPAAEVIPPGRGVTLKSDGTVELPKDAALANLFGVSVYRSSAPPGGYQIGDMVPILRKGRIWADFTGTGATELEQMKLRHASTDGASQAQHRGKFTDAAADVDAGEEVTAIPTTGVVSRGGATGLVKLELNLP